ncbi:hypothetical protein Taro_010121 [Colocasia esculenta]|uniref:PPIase cyclophilin-type domain-containing protein n=1 Tax=Colocasia esculenta TaxID=4460 RepID=A0A843U2S8_COLES|nr:hypothetical protein [Colocasia esculenta]
MAPAIAATSSPLLPPQLHHHYRHHPRSALPPSRHPQPTTRRALLLSAAAAPALLARPPANAAEADAPAAPPPDAAAPPATTITDRVFMDFSICPSYFRSDRPIGSANLAACPDPEPIGRVVFGLYGKLVPVTVANFKAMCTSAAYRGALVHKLLQGQYFAAGRQGRREKGEITPTPDLLQNTETVDPKAFQLKHLRPGTLSLSLSENDDYEQIKMDPNYRNVEFLVTTGPGPCPQLDNQNIVFGTVLEGLDVVTSIATTPTYKPAERIRQFNDFAVFLGDERAQMARASWDRPLRTLGGLTAKDGFLKNWATCQRVA